MASRKGSNKSDRGKEEMQNIYASPSTFTLFIRQPWSIVNLNRQSLQTLLASHITSILLAIPAPNCKPLTLMGSSIVDVYPVVVSIKLKMNFYVKVGGVHDSLAMRQAYP